MVDSLLGKKYKLSSSENFDEFMKKLGVGVLTRKLGGAVTPVVDLAKVDDEYTLSSNSTFKNIALKFKPGVEFLQETPDGRKVKTVITVDGATLHEVQTDDSGKITTIDRIFSNDEIKMEMKFEDVVATRIYKAE